MATAAPRSGRGRAVAVAVGITALAFVVSLIGGVALAVPVLVLELDIQRPAIFLALTAAGQVGFLAVGYAYARRYGLTVPIRTPTARQLAIGLGGAVLAMVVATVLSVVVTVLGLLPSSVIGDAGTQDPIVYLGLAALSVVLVAPVEEFVFRGVVQGRLRQSFGPVGAVAGSSLLFGSMHLANYAGNPQSVVAGALLIACVGAVFGSLYERTGNLAVTIVTHATYNAVLLGIAYVGA
ncbi:MAG: lysostaphin resistance A-like protein [Haloarculaceae archaeon]